MFSFLENLLSSIWVHISYIRSWICSCWCITSKKDFKYEALLKVYDYLNVKILLKKTEQKDFEDFPVIKKYEGFALLGWNEIIKHTSKMYIVLIPNILFCWNWYSIEKFRFGMKFWNFFEQINSFSLNDETLYLYLGVNSNEKFI